IAIISVAIGIGELQCFDDRMNVIRAVPLHRFQIELLENVERFKKDWALASEGMFVDLVTPIVGSCRLFDPREKFSEVIILKRCLMLLQKPNHLGREIALIKAVTSSNNAGGPSL